MHILDKIKALISSATEEMTAEELRRIIADVNDEIVTAELDITALTTRVSELETQNDGYIAEIDRLKEENGRLFKERLGSSQSEEKEEKEEKETEDEKIAKLESEIDY